MQDRLGTRCGIEVGRTVCTSNNLATKVGFYDASAQGPSFNGVPAASLSLDPEPAIPESDGHVGRQPNDQILIIGLVMHDAMPPIDMDAGRRVCMLPIRMPPLAEPLYHLGALDAPLAVVMPRTVFSLHARDDITFVACKVPVGQPSCKSTPISIAVLNADRTGVTMRKPKAHDLSLYWKLP